MFRFAIIFSILLFTSCFGRRKYQSHDVGLEVVKKEEQYLESRIIDFKTIGIADTVLATISGNVFMTFIFKTKEKSEPLEAGWITATNLSTDYSYNSYFDKAGFYKLYIAPGIYNINYKSVGVDDVAFDSISFRSGEIKKLDLELAMSGFTIKKNYFFGFPEIHWSRKNINDSALGDVPK